MSRLHHAKDHCEKQRFKLWIEESNFLSKNGKQIEAMVNSVSQGLKLQLAILRGYEKGRAYDSGPGGENAPVDFTLPDGSVVHSSVISFDDVDESNHAVSKTIPISNLVKYIKKFEAAAASVPDRPADVDAFLKPYQDPKAQLSPDFYFMTLNQAQKAYAGCTTSGCLARDFQRSMNQQEGRVLSLGTGKHAFLVTTVTTLGWQKEYGNYFGSALPMTPSNHMEINLEQSFTEAFQTAEEGAYWKMIRQQQLTLIDPDTNESVPIDGYLRKVYFDRKQSSACRLKDMDSFDPNLPPGPAVSYREKKACTRVGINVVSASIQKKIMSWPITDYAKKWNGKKLAVDTFYEAVAATGKVGSCDYVTLHFRYQCGCDPEIHELDPHYKIDRSVTITCDR